MSERESMDYDLVIVGAGPRARRRPGEEDGRRQDREVSVCISKRGRGRPTYVGAVIDPRALNELIPDWKDKGAPLTVPVTENHHWVLSAKGKWGFPHWAMPAFMNNKGTYSASLGNLCRWLAGEAEALGVEIFPGFAAAEILFNDDGSVKGVATGDMGVARDGKRKPDWQPGMELHARYTFFAEGARGNLTKELTRIFELSQASGRRLRAWRQGVGTFLPKSISLGG